MTKSEMLAKISRDVNVPVSTVSNVIDAMVNCVSDELCMGNKVTIAGFGRFEMRDRKSKSYTNPKTKEQSKLAPTRIPGFKASGLLKQRLEEGRKK